MSDDYGPPWSMSIAPDGSKTCKWPLYYDQYWHTHHGELYRDAQPTTTLESIYLMTFDSRGILSKWTVVEP
jgi:hypothetical protein